MSLEKKQENLSFRKFRPEFCEKAEFLLSSVLFRVAKKKPAVSSETPFSYINALSFRTQKAAFFPRLLLSPRRIACGFIVRTMLYYTWLTL